MEESALPTEAFQVRKISNSEVTSWLSCRLQYSFAFMNNLTPRDTPMPLARGTLGHLAFQYYIEARLNNSNHDSAMNKAREAFTEALASKSLEVNVVGETQFLFQRYMDVNRGWPNWELLGTEQAHEIPINDEIIMPMRYDVLIRERDSDRILIGDFKFAYNFWTIDDHALNGQMPKYITIMNSAGMKVDGGVLIEIRTRPLSAKMSADHRNLWKHTHYYPSIAKKRNLLKQHVSASLEIVEFRKMSPEDQEYKLIPVLNKHGACKYCNFKELCASKIDGKDITFDMQHGFVENTYGYNDKKTTDLGELL